MAVQYKPCAIYVNQFCLQEKNGDVNICRKVQESPKLAMCTFQENDQQNLTLKQLQGVHADIVTVFQLCCENTEHVIIDWINRHDVYFRGKKMYGKFEGIPVSLLEQYVCI